MANVPKPEFVILDVESNSFVTAFDYYHVESPDKSKIPILICGTNDGTISIWSLKTYRCLHRLPMNLFPLLKQDDLLRSNTIISQSNENDFRILCHFKNGLIYSINIDQQLSCYKLKNCFKTFQMSFVKCFHITNRLIAFIQPDDSSLICVRNTEKEQNVCKFKLTNQIDQNDHGMIMSMYLIIKDPISRLSLEMINEEKQIILIITAYEDGHLVLYRSSLPNTLDFLIDNRQSENLIYESKCISIISTHNVMLTCMDWHSATHRGICCSVNDEISLLELNIPETLIKEDDSIEIAKQKMNQALCKNKFGIYENVKRRIKLTNHGIMCCTIRPDGRLFATGGNDGRIRLFTMKHGKPLAIIPFHTNVIECIRFVPDVSNDESNKGDKYKLIASSRENSISIWNLYND